MKKYSIRLLTLVMSVIMLGSCSDFLESNPTDRLPSDKTPSLRDAEKIVNGFYHSMKWNDYYGTPLMVLGETRGDDLRPTRTDNGYSAIYNYNFSPTNNAYGGIWDKAYNVIMNTNLLLSHWDDIEAFTQAEIDRKNVVKGQALTVRALCHFDIARVYGYPYQKNNGTSLGAVIADKVFPIGHQQERVTVAKTYEFVIKDLETALSLLNTSTGKKKSHGNFNYWGAKGLLARVYLYMGDYDNAFKYADEILTDTSNPYKLVTNQSYIESWAKEDSSETMLELLINSVNGLDSNGGVDSWYYLMWHGPGFASGSLVPTDAWFTLLNEDPDDVRQGLVEWRYPTGTQSFTPYKWLAKFPGNNGEGDFKRNHPMIMRLSEIYLIAAEAALKMAPANQAKADTYLHAIRQRANPAATQVTATETLVLNERRKELIGEGHRYYDLGRLGYSINRTASDNQLLGSSIYKTVDPWNRLGAQYQVILPMSQTQRLANPASAQNPGYTD